jgi:hypothetical protein
LSGGFHRAAKPKISEKDLFQTLDIDQKIRDGPSHLLQPSAGRNRIHLGIRQLDWLRNPCVTQLIFISI